MITQILNKIVSQSRQESGQMAIAVVLALPVVFIFLALGMDAGLWYFDHRTAQNQADAAVLAAVQYLPAEETDDNYAMAVDAVDAWLVKNGSGPAQLDCGDGRPSPEFFDLHPSANPDGRLDAVRVCVRRRSAGLFSNMSGIPWVHVSAAATARVGPAVGIANVMPWALVPDDTTCDTPGQMCQADMNGDGVVEADENCGYYPPAPGLAVDAVWGDTLCPFGMSEDKLWVFKASDPITPGNFAPISACGLGNVNYVACIEGAPATEFYEAGETVNVEVQTGSLGANTDAALDNRYADEGADGIWECDVESTPMPLSALDPDGHRRAKAKFVQGNPYTDVDLQTYDYVPGCEYRLVAVPVIDHFPTGGSEDVLVVGVATFGIAKWDRTPQYGNALGNGAQPCGTAISAGPVDPAVNFKCQMVWGYFIRDARPPQVLLHIGETDNPFAPNMIAMVE